MNADTRHAVVLGASGITGWAIVNAILGGYPTPDAFDKVSALVNRPLSRDVARWPDDRRLQIVSGIDLLKGSQADLEKAMRENVAGVETATHIYFYCPACPLLLHSSGQIADDRHAQHINRTTTMRRNVASTRTC